MKKILKTAALLLGITAFISCTDNKKLTIGSIIFDTSNEWFVEAIAGMQDASKDLNTNLSVVDIHYDLNVEKESIREQLKKKAAAIVICPLTTEESGQALTEAAALGVPVVTWNTVVKPEPNAQIVVDAKKLGSATGDYLVEYVRKNNLKGLKAGLVVDRNYSIGIARCDGFRSSIKPLVESGELEVVSEITGELVEEVKVSVKKMLSERSDINFIWCWNQMTLVATVDVLKELGRPDILVAGTDMSLALAKDMLQDEVNLIAVTTQQPYKLGYEAVATAAKLASGIKTEKGILIPTLTYTREDKAALEEYVRIHAKYVTK
ncbi:MAG: substrate-binding domain-containing protein [Treponema sp.]|nr:substrate-binding domain-containing protein [Treponema sp.]